MSTRHRGGRVEHLKHGGGSDWSPSGPPYRVAHIRADCASCDIHQRSTGYHRRCAVLSLCEFLLYGDSNGGSCGPSSLYLRVFPSPPACLVRELSSYPTTLCPVVLCPTCQPTAAFYPPPPPPPPRLIPLIPLPSWCFRPVNCPLGPLTTRSPRDLSVLSLILLTRLRSVYLELAPSLQCLDSLLFLNLGTLPMILLDTLDAFAILVLDTSFQR